MPYRILTITVRFSVIDLFSLENFKIESWDTVYRT